MCKHSLCPCRACALVLAFPTAKSLLVEQELERQKEKERAQGGRGGGDTGWEQLPIPAPAPTLWKEQQKGKEAEDPSQALHRALSSSHFSIHAPQGSSGSSAAPQKDKTSPKPSPAPWTTANLLFPGAELSGQPGRSSRCLVFLHISKWNGQQSPAPGELLQPNRGFPTGAACKRREGREGAGINYTCANETPRTWREAVKGQSRGGSSASLCNLII